MNKCVVMATKTRKDPGSNASFASITAATKCLGFTDNGFKNLRNNKTTEAKLFFLKLNVTGNWKSRERETGRERERERETGTEREFAQKEKKRPLQNLCSLTAPGMTR